MNLLVAMRRLIQKAVLHLKVQEMQGGTEDDDDHDATADIYCGIIMSWPLHLALYVSFLNESSHEKWSRSTPVPIAGMRKWRCKEVK